VNLKNEKKNIDFDSRNHSMEIDSLRGVAILLVFFYHVLGSMMPENIQIPDHGFGYLLSFVYTGSTGVTLFFVISSFLLTMPFYLKPHYSRVTFYKKRLLRILPLFYIVVTIAGIATVTDLSKLFHVLKSYLFLFNGWTLFPFSVPWWSLRTEMEFYLFLGLLMPLVHYKKGKYALLISLIVIFVVRFLIIINPVSSTLQIVLINSVIAFAPTFLIGAIISVIYIKYGAAIKKYFYNSIVFKNGLSDILFLIILFFLSTVLHKVSKKGGIIATDQSWPQHFSYEAFFWSIILLSIIVLPLKLKIIFSNKYLAKLGEISYSFYLIHLPVIFYINFTMPPIRSELNLFFCSKVMLIFTAALLLSFLSYRYIETPFLKMKDKIG